MFQTSLSWSVKTCSWPGKEPLHWAARRSLAAARTGAAHPKNKGMKPATIKFYTKMLPVSHNIPWTPENRSRRTIKSKEQWPWNQCAEVWACCKAGEPCRYFHTWWSSNWLQKSDCKFAVTIILINGEMEFKYFHHVGCQTQTFKPLVTGKPLPSIIPFCLLLAVDPHHCRANYSHLATGLVLELLPQLGQTQTENYQGWRFSSSFKNISFKQLNPFQGCYW